MTNELSQFHYSAIHSLNAIETLNILEQRNGKLHLSFL